MAGKILKVKMKVREMVDADPEFVSVVDNPANRVPFRKTANAQKGGPMNFFNLFGTSEEVEKSEPIVEVVALAVSAEGDMDAAKAIAKAAGFEHTDEPLEAPGAMLLVKDADFVLDSSDPLQITVKLNQHLAAVVTVAKEFQPFSGSTDFSENLKGRSFFTSLSGGIETVHDTVIEIMFSDGDRAELVEKAGEAFDDFAAFGKTLVAELPNSVLKFEQVIKALVGVTGPGSPDSGGAAEDVEENQNEEIARSPVVGKSEDKPEGDETEKEERESDESGTQTALQEAFETQKTEHKAEVDGLKSELAKLVTAVKTVSQTVNKLAGKTVLVQPDADEKPEEVKKVDQGFFQTKDTAMAKLDDDWFDTSAEGS